MRKLSEKYEAYLTRQEERMREGNLQRMSEACPVRARRRRSLWGAVSAVQRGAGRVMYEVTGAA